MRAIERLVRVPGTQVVATERGSIAGQVHDHLTPAIRRVYAIGGDGTAGDVATALVDTDVALGIIPCGTTNVLAREFGISMRTKRAVEQLEASNRTARLRTWQVGEHTAVLGCGVGWDARVMWNAPQAVKQRMGRTGVALIGLREIATYEFPPLVLTGVDEHGATVTLRGTSVILATVKRWAGGNTGIPQADSTDDFIDAVVLESKSRLHLLTFWTLMTTPGGRPLKLAGVRTARLRSARVECEDGRAIEAHVNGEGVAKTPFALEPGGVVQVLVP